MTIRDEEILNASTAYHEEQFHCNGWNYDFIEGAKWADQNPRKGLWDSEKVCKVLKDYMLKERFFDNRIERTAIIDNIVCDLRKAMEE